MSPEYLLWSKRHGINIPVVIEHCRTQRTYTFPGNWTHRLHRRCFDFYICYFQNNALFIIFLLLENVSAMKGKGCLIYRYIVNVNVIGSRHIKQCVTVWREESLSEISQLRRRGFLTAKQPEQGRVNEWVCLCVWRVTNTCSGSGLSFVMCEMAGGGLRRRGELEHRTSSYATGACPRCGRQWLILWFRNRTGAGKGVVGYRGL